MSEAGLEWKKDKSAHAALDLVTSSVQHVLLRTPATSTVFPESVCIAEVRDKIRSGALEDLPYILVTQQTAHEQTIIVPNLSVSDSYRAWQKQWEQLIELDRSNSPSVDAGQWQISGPWQVLKVRGPLEHHLIGVMQALTTSLMAAGVSIFAISSWDTDYLLIKSDRYDEAVAQLSKDGWKVVKT